MPDQPSCATCDFMRHEGAVMRCYADPPAALLLGAVPNKLQGLPPQLVIGGFAPETHAERFCRWHPELRADGVKSPGRETAEATVAQARSSLILDGTETRQ